MDNKEFSPLAFQGYNSIIIRISKWDWAKLKKPVLSVQIGGRLCKVASFNSDETAMWFSQKFREFLDLEEQNEKSE